MRSIQSFRALVNLTSGTSFWSGELAYADPAEGTKTTYAELDQPVSLAPVVANQTLYVLDDSGRITAYR